MPFGTSRHASLLAGAAATAAILLASPAALAQNADTDQRYTIERTDDGFIRMDQQTGQMSVCMFAGNQLVCAMAADDRVAYDTDIQALEERVAALEARLGSGEAADGGLPSEDEFEQTLSYMERFMKRFMGVVEDFAKDEPAPQEPLPDRT